MRKDFQDLTGKRFVRLTVMGYSHKTGEKRHTKHHWHCRCDCGKETTVAGDTLKKGGTRSCGCLMKEINGNRKRKHGCWKMPEYRAWSGMMARCHNPKNHAYVRYGGRGITVCERWHTLQNFLADMGQRPTEKHTLERIDNNKGYCPENCCWATMKAQGNNRRDNLLVQLEGEVMTLQQAADRTGLSRDQVRKKVSF